MDEVLGRGCEEWRRVVMGFVDSSHGLADVSMEQTADLTGGLTTRLGNRTECLPIVWWRHPCEHPWVNGTGPSGVSSSRYLLRLLWMGAYTYVFSRTPTTKYLYFNEPFRTNIYSLNMFSF